MSEKPLNEYIDMEAYDVVSGAVHRALQARMKDDELELKTLADQVIEAEKDKSAAVDAAHHWHHRAQELEEALREITREAPLLGSDGRETTAHLNGYECRKIARRALGL